MPSAPFDVIPRPRGQPSKAVVAPPCRTRIEATLGRGCSNPAGDCRDIERSLLGGRSRRELPLGNDRSPGTAEPAYLDSLYHPTGFDRPVVDGARASLVAGISGKSGREAEAHGQNGASGNEPKRKSEQAGFLSPGSPQMSCSSLTENTRPKQPPYVSQGVLGDQAGPTTDRRKAALRPQSPGWSRLRPGRLQRGPTIPPQRWPPPERVWKHRR